MREKHYFVCGHTAKGYVDLFRSNLEPLKKIYILMGGSMTGKLNVMKRIASRLEEFTECVEYLHNPSNPEILNGVLFPGLGIGIVDGSSSQVLEVRAPGAIEEYVNLSESWDTAKLSCQREKILDLRSRIEQCYEKAYTSFANGLKVHDEWEKIYIENMNFEKADELTEYLISSLFHDEHFNKAALILHRFLGGSTPYGPMDFVDNITAEITTRYFIKGRPGSGKSTILKKLLQAAKERGIDSEVYHCGFDPDSLDMLLFPELSICIFDSTFPHEYYPSREGDMIIDTYTELINEGTDERHADLLADIVARYRVYTREGTAYLSEAKGYLEELEQLYQNATDFSMIDHKWNKLYLKIMNFHPQGPNIIT